MKAADIYNYENLKFAFLREPMRNLIGAWGNAEKWFATLKEWPLIHGMPRLSSAIHFLEHAQPTRLDVWADAFRPWLLPLEYPATPELAEEITDIDSLFALCINIIDEIDAALGNMVKAADPGEFHSLSVVTENLQIENSGDKSLLLQAWAMWDNNPDAAAFDQFAGELLPQKK